MNITKLRIACPYGACPCGRNEKKRKPDTCLLQKNLCLICDICGLLFYHRVNGEYTELTEKVYEYYKTQDCLPLWGLPLWGLPLWGKVIVSANSSPCPFSWEEKGRKARLQEWMDEWK